MIDFDMSPYGSFVWGAYAISSAVLLAATVIVLRRSKRTARQLAELTA